MKMAGRRAVASGARVVLLLVQDAVGGEEGKPSGEGNMALRRAAGPSAAGRERHGPARRTLRIAASSAC